MVKGKGEENRVLVAIGYILGLLAILLYLVRKKEGSEFELYHYKQATVLGIIALVLTFIPIINLISWIMVLVFIGFAIMVWKGEDPRYLKDLVDKVNL